MSPDNGPPAAESRDSNAPMQALGAVGTAANVRAPGAARPPLDDVSSPAFEAWANGKTVPDHLANAQQLLELLAVELGAQSCELRACPRCALLRDYVAGLRSRLAAIALRAMPKGDR